MCTTTFNRDPACSAASPRDPDASAVEARSAIREQDVDPQGMSVFPNPASNNFSIILDGLNAASELKIFNTTGRLIYQQDVSKNTSKINIDANTGSYTDGVYIIIVQSDNNILTDRIVINK